MLLEADLPDDVDALRALVLEQARTLADLTDAKSKADARI
jgi:transposase